MVSSTLWHSKARAVRPWIACQVRVSTRGYFASGLPVSNWRSMRTNSSLVAPLLEYRSLGASTHGNDVIEFKTDRRVMLVRVSPGRCRPNSHWNFYLGSGALFPLRYNAAPVRLSGHALVASRSLSCFPAARSCNRRWFVAPTPPLRLVSIPNSTSAAPAQFNLD
jgi:hypothetical protein